MQNVKDIIYFAIFILETLIVKSGVAKERMLLYSQVVHFFLLSSSMFSIISVCL